MKPNDRVRIDHVSERDSLASIFAGKQQGRVLRVYPKLNIVIVEFDEDHIFRLRPDEVKLT